MKKLIVISLLLLASISACKTSDNPEVNAPYVILVSFDGFRHDYVEKFDTPNFKAFIKEGTAAQSMTPSYPSKTFPNHYTMVTGMYPGNHGLVDNTFYDPQRETTYRISSRTHVQDAYYYGGLPLWQLVQQNGMKSASYFWVGSEAPITGSYPDYYELFNGSVPDEERISEVADWLKLPEAERPRFVTLYFELVDSQGHATGPDAEETKQTVLEADRLLGLLMAEVESLPLDVNVILTSDHGMHKLENTPETFIYLEDIFDGIDLSDQGIINNGTHAHLFIDNNELYEDVYRVVKSHESHFSIYKKEETPERWHYRDSDRIGDFLIVAEPGHHITTHARQQQRPETRQEWGNHGFDPYASDQLGAIFYAKGPNIKQGLEIGPFENVHIYPFIAEILGITPPENIDGDLAVLAPILR